MTLREKRKSLGLTLVQAGEMLGLNSPKQGFYSLEQNWPDIQTSAMMELARVFGSAIVVTGDGVRFETDKG